jgi:hypothetical protein
VRLSVSLADDLEGQEQAEASGELRSTIYRLRRDLEAAKAKREELVAAVYQAATDAARGITIDRVPPPTRDRRVTKPEVAICLLADWQWGKVTPAYNSDVAKERVRRYGEKVVELIANEREKHPVREARIYLLGDLLEGEEIFPGQAHRIDASLYTQMFEAAEALAQVVRTIASSVPRSPSRARSGTTARWAGRSAAATTPRRTSTRCSTTSPGCW